MSDFKGYLLEGFNKKFIFCGSDYLILKEYSLPYLKDVPKSDLFGKKNFDNSPSTPKRYDSLKRTRDTVAQYVYTNLTPHTKFLMLTTADTILDVPIFQRKLTTFIQSMRRNGYDLRYLYVYERQTQRGKKEGNKGALHVHMIIFNNEKIDMSILKKCWSHGRVELKIFNGLRCKKDKVSQELIINPALASQTTVRRTIAIIVINSNTLIYSVQRIRAQAQCHIFSNYARVCLLYKTVTV